MHEAKTHLSKLVAAAAEGEEIVIARAGKPVARLVAYNGRGPRTPGGWEGKVSISEDFDDDEELIALFEGSESYDP